jgi:ubiquinone/menaquinone biosynthesis C-methylase UbiE
VLSRPKQGFGVPIQEWINEQLRERIRDTLTDPLTRQRGYVTNRYVDVLLDEHERGRRDHSMALWALLMLELWHRLYVDKGSERRKPAVSEIIHVRGGLTVAERQHIQEWEHEEIERSAFEASHINASTLRYSENNIVRYLDAADDAFHALEYSHHLLGDIQGQTVLDFGCGSGKNSVLLARRGANVIAMDISGPIINVARQRMLANNTSMNVCFLNGSAHNIPLANESVDLVFGIAILHHLELNLVSREVLRVLRPGGRAIFQEPVRNSKLIKMLRGLIPYQAEDVSPFERPLTDEELHSFASCFSRYNSKAFTLPYVNLIGIVPVVNKFLTPLHQFDHSILKRFPSLDYYATVRVIEMVK